jgi:hypothetical protein
LRRKIQKILVKKGELVTEAAEAQARLAKVDADIQGEVAAINRHLTALASAKARADSDLAAAEANWKAARKNLRDSEKSKDKAARTLFGAQIVRNRVRNCVFARVQELTGPTETGEGSKGSKGIDMEAIDKLGKGFHDPGGKEPSGQAGQRQDDAYVGTPGADSPAQPAGPIGVGFGGSVNRPDPRIDHNQLQNQLPPPTPRARKSDQPASGKCGKG